MTYAPQDASYRLASDPSGSGNLLDGRSSGRQSLYQLSLTFTHERYWRSPMDMMRQG
jgi:hypothetical protein